MEGRRTITRHPRSIAELVSPRHTDRAACRPFGRRRESTSPFAPVRPESSPRPVQSRPRPSTRRRAGLARRSRRPTCSTSRSATSSPGGDARSGAAPRARAAAPAGICRPVDGSRSTPRMTSVIPCSQSSATTANWYVQLPRRSRISTSPHCADGSCTWGPSSRSSKGSSPESIRTRQPIPSASPSPRARHVPGYRRSPSGPVATRCSSARVQAHP